MYIQTLFGLTALYIFLIDENCLCLTWTHSLTFTLNKPFFLLIIFTDTDTEISYAHFIFLL